MILPAKVETVLCVRARAGSHRPAGGLGRNREEAGRCSTFLELSELKEVRNSALCAARCSLLSEPAAWRGWSGARPCSPPTHLESHLQLATRKERSALGNAQQSALLWERRMARRGHKRNKGPEGEKPLHEMQVKTEVTVKYSLYEGGAAGRRRRVGPAGGGRGPRRRLLGEFYRPFNHQHLSSQSGEAELCTSIESGLQGEGRQVAQPEGAATRLPFLLSHCDRERVNWVSALNSRSPNTPAKRKVKEKRVRSRSEDKHPRRWGKGGMAVPG